VRLHYNGILLPLPANILLGVKWTGMANTLAYYDTTIITVVISFVAQAPGPYTIKHFTAVINSVLW
jgi:hypothetical protein